MAEWVKYPTRIIYSSNCKKFLSCIKCIMNKESLNFCFKTFIVIYLLYLHWQFIKHFYTHIYHTLLIMTVLHCCMCKSCFLLVLCTCISELCLRFHLYFFKKHNISNIYNETSINILNFLNTGLHDLICVSP